MNERMNLSAARAALEGFLAPPTSVDPVPSNRRVAVALMASSPASTQAGAAFGAMAFPVIGPVGVVVIRQTVSALILGSWIRPNMRKYGPAEWKPVLGLAVAFCTMNLSIYAAIERLGLGLAVVLEFLGPLTVALVTSRRRGDIAWALLAAVGVVVLLRPGPSSDFLGIGYALLAAVSWASYILLSRTLSIRLPGIEGTASASIIAAIIWVPVALAWFPAHPPTSGAIGLAALCGLMSSALPYAADIFVLRHVPTHVFATVASVNPVFAALAGWLMLAQVLGALEWLGIALIVAANVLVTTAGLRQSQ